MHLSVNFIYFTMFQVLCFVVLSLQTFTAGVSTGTSCITLYQESGTCVKPFLCPAILSAYDAIPDQALQFLQDSQCGCDTGKVCCGPSINNTYSQRLTCGSTIKEKENVIIARVSDASICGLDKFTTSRIRGGTTTDFGEFPWLVAIESNSTYTSNSAGIRCGGSILNKRYILTAAHCIAHYEFVATKVWLGVTNIGPEGNCLNITGTNPKCVDSVQKMNIQETIPHPSYDSIKRSNDIGLVRVENLIEYSEHIRPICLPSSTSATPTPGVFMTVTGWGATEDSGTGSNIKLKVQLPIQNNSLCNIFLKAVFIEISEKQICVGGEPGKDSCQGDSGGPLMKYFTNANGDYQWIQEGIVSYGHGCGRKDRPAVYTKVSSYIQWIYYEINKQEYNLEKRSVCTTPNGDVGTCVPLSTCEEVFTKVATKNKDSHKFAYKSECGYDDETLVCCEYPGPTILPNFDSPALPNKTTCGVMKDKPKIYGGTLAELGEFPWVVRIEYTSKSSGENEGIKCIGSIVNSRYVVTAAICILEKRYTPITVWVGDWQISSDPDCVKLLANVECADPVQKIPIKQTIIHPFFQRRLQQNDIGLILLENQIKFSDYASPICLPSPNLPPLELGTRMTVIGWGRTENMNKSDILRKVAIPLVSHKICEKVYKGTIGSQHLCVGGEKDMDSCAGDAGGPLMRIYEDKADATIHWYQEGLTLFGLGCGRENIPGVRISSYTNWIIRIISED